MRTNKKTTIILLLISALCFITVIATAQGPGFDDDVMDTPIDGGATIMLAVAAGYGYKKLKDARNKKHG